jgi:hypothetical protein
VASLQRRREQRGGSRVDARERQEGATAMLGNDRGANRMGVIVWGWDFGLEPRFQRFGLVS